MNGPITRDPWDNVERQLLTAVQQPATLRGVAALTDLPLDTMKNQLAAMHARELVLADITDVTDVPDGVQYQITLAGRRRLVALAATTPGQYFGQRDNLCGQKSKSGASFGNCAEHEEALLECHWPDGSPRR